MSNESITRESLGEAIARQSDWERIERLTEDEVRVAATRDPDAQPTTEADWDHAVVVAPEDRGLSRKQPSGRPVSTAPRFELRLDPELKAWADGYAKSLGIKTAGLIRMLLLKEKQRVASS